MRRIAIEREPTPEVTVTITWQQWEDGSWAAWLVDSAGRQARQVRNREELAAFLEQRLRSETAETCSASEAGEG